MKKFYLNPGLTSKPVFKSHFDVYVLKLLYLEEKHTRLSDLGALLHRMQEEIFNVSLWCAHICLILGWVSSFLSTTFPGVNR